MTATAHALFGQFSGALGGPGPTPVVALPDGGSLASAFAVSDLAQASVAVAGASLARLVAVGGVGGVGGVGAPTVRVDRDLASAWFAYSLRPEGWSLPPTWDPVAGDYATADGWIRLHTNAPHHRAAALSVLETDADRSAVADAVAGWTAGSLESAVVDSGGAAAAMRSATEWDRHPQGRSVAAEPLFHVEATTTVDGGAAPGPTDRPLAGVRVLDLTRVLAGPVATRLLAGWGAEVLRIDPPWWDEPALAPEVTLGKHCARLDLTTPAGRDRLLGLLATTDVLVHGYRSDALDALDLGAEVRSEVRPGLVDVSLDAYGWSGPWARRRGFDSLVQMSSGIAEAGMAVTGADHPVPLPVQALDMAAGYLVAASALTGLTRRRTEGTGTRWRTSLARVARSLVDAGTADRLVGDGIEPAPPAPGGPVEHTVWGDARRLPPPVEVEGTPLHWSVPAGPLGSSDPVWPTD